ncbi:MAG TPA: GDCCVxC domain-containing (seleno)protein [Candidatus Elarobacter sp.]|nr:GDCCVxC domain-containing (seleno)protein [Candidatus Elarobacter sp.]
MAPVLTSELRCPHCGHVETLTMPDDACVFVHPCAACGAVIRPKDGDCCVFCSFGTVACPPMQCGSGCGTPFDAPSTCSPTSSSSEGLS